MDEFEDFSSMDELLEHPTFSCERTTLVRVIDTMHVRQFVGVSDGERFIDDGCEGIFKRKIRWDAREESLDPTRGFQDAYRWCKNASWLAWPLVKCLPKRTIVGAALSCLVTTNVFEFYTENESDLWHLFNDWYENKITTQDVAATTKTHIWRQLDRSAGLYDLHSFILSTDSFDCQNDIAFCLAKFASFCIESHTSHRYGDALYDGVYNEKQLQFVDHFRRCINFRDVVEGMLVQCI